LRKSEKGGKYLANPPRPLTGGEKKSHVSWSGGTVKKGRDSVLSVAGPGKETETDRTTQLTAPIGNKRERFKADK